VFKNEFLPISNDFDFIIINVKILFNFEKGWCKFDKKKECLKKKKKNHCVNCFENTKGLLKHHQFASSFEQ
jgi:hypothetical protein